MSQDDNSSIGTSLVVFLLGVAVGATVAILYAPASGSETRAKVVDSTAKLKERIAELTHELAEKTKELRRRTAPEETAEPTEATTAVEAES